MPTPDQIQRAALRIVERARALIADPDNMDVRRDYMRATFNLDWTAAAIASLAADKRTVIEEVATERRRQIEVEGWTPNHDDAYREGEMAAAAAAYAFNAYTTTAPRYLTADPLGFWPWPPSWWKPRGARRDLIRAAALIVAEIERLDRAQHEGREHE